MNTAQQNTVNLIFPLIADRLNARAVVARPIQNDPITGSTLVKFSFTTGVMALVWVCTNGAAKTISGSRVWNASGRPKKCATLKELCA